MLVQATATSRYSSFVVLNLVTFCIKFVWSGYCKELQHRWSLQFWTVILKPSSRSTNSFAVAHEICVKLILYRVATPLNLMFKMLDPGSCCHCFFCAVNYHNLGEVGCLQSSSIEIFWQQPVHLSCSRRISFEALRVDKISWCKIVKLMLLMVQKLLKQLWLHVFQTHWVNLFSIHWNCTESSFDSV